MGLEPLHVQVAVAAQLRIAMARSVVVVHERGGDDMAAPREIDLDLVRPGRLVGRLDGDAAQHAPVVPELHARRAGTGLGLYIASEVCAGNQATLTHVPTETGCCFRITFTDPRRQRTASV